MLWSLQFSPLYNIAFSQNIKQYEKREKEIFLRINLGHAMT